MFIKIYNINNKILGDEFMKNIMGDIIFIIIILFTHLLIISTQLISSRDYFYGVYVKSIELDDNFKNEIDKWFKSSSNKVLFIVIIIYFIFEFLFILNTAMSILLFTCIYLYLSYINLKKAYIKVKGYKDKYVSKHNIEINKKYNKLNNLYKDEELTLIQNKVVKKFKLLFGVCIGLSILSFLYVAINYKSMPETIITHWGFNGEPDGFSQKSIKDVFFMNFIDLSMVILLVYIFLGSLKSRIYIDNDKKDENLIKAKKYLNGIGYSSLFLILSMQSMTTTIPIYMVNQENIPIVIIIIGCIVSIFITVALIYFYIMITSLNTKDKSVYKMESDDEKWIYGFIYYNEDDPQFLVQKRLGAGWNVNMANPKGKIFTILVFIITIVSLVLPFI